MRRSFLHLVIIAIAGCLLLLPVILYGFPAYSHDGWIHALWSANFSHQLWTGDLYPRWLGGLNKGLGSPAFFFYPPLPYYLTSVSKFFFPHDAQGWLPLGGSVLGAVITAAACAYLWLRRMVSDAVACAAAIFYTALPYHLIVDLYIRGAFAELFGFIWMPLALYFTLRFEDRPRLALIGLAASYALLIVSHLPTALIFAPLPVGYACLLAKPQQRRRAFAVSSLAIALGAGLSAIYLLPAITMRQFVSMQKMRQPVTYFGNWFLFSSSSWRELNMQITLIASASVVLAICFFAFAARAGEKPVKRESKFWLWVSLLAFLMMTPESRPLWKLLPLLQNIQFPFRFNAILAISATALFALALEHAKAAGPRTMRVCRAAAAAMLLCLCLLTAAYGWRQYSIHNQLGTVNNDLVENNMDAPEYRPYWANRDSAPPNNIRVIEGQAIVSLESQQARNLVFEVNAASQATVDLPQFYFPGWQWRQLGANGFHDAQASPQTGLVRILIPGGRYQVELRLNATWPERSGQIISAFCCGLLVLIYARRPRY